MRCDEFQKRIDLEFVRGDFEITGELRSHLDTCESCQAYLTDLLAMRTTLNSQSFEVQPGELDSITFENLIDSGTEIRTDYKRSISLMPFIFRWVWAPVAAAAIVVLMLLIPGNRITKPVSEGDSVYSWDTWDYIYSEAENDTIYSKMLEAIEPSDDEFSLAADELVSGVSIYEAIDNMTDDELQDFYERISDINGST